MQEHHRLNAHVGISAADLRFRAGYSKVPIGALRDLRSAKPSSEPAAETRLHRVLTWCLSPQGLDIAGSLRPQNRQWPVSLLTTGWECGDRECRVRVERTAPGTLNGRYSAANAIRTLGIAILDAHCAFLADDRRQCWKQIGDGAEMSSCEGGHSEKWLASRSS